MTLRDALVVLRDGAAFLFVLAVLVFGLWLVAP